MAKGDKIHRHYTFPDTEESNTILDQLAPFHRSQAMIILLALDEFMEKYNLKRLTPQQAAFFYKSYPFLKNRIGAAVQHAPAPDLQTWPQAAPQKAAAPSEPEPAIVPVQAVDTEPEPDQDAVLGSTLPLNAGALASMENFIAAFSK